MINVLSLFDGLSGARIALDKLGIKCNYYASEIDKYAIQVSKYNYPDIIRLGDIKNIKGKNLPQIDLLIGGSPCQDLSVAKKDRQGLAGTRSGLFYEYVRLLKKCKPKYFILENVNSMPKESKKIISEILGVEPIIINSALVSAQNRKRLYWVGELINGIYQTVKIEQPEDKHIYLKDILEKNVDKSHYIKNINELNWITDSKRIKKKYCQFNGNKSLCLMARTYANWNGTYIDKPIRIGQIGKGGQGDRIYSPRGKSVNLSANGGGGGAKTGLYHISHGYKKEKIEQVNKYPTLCGQSPRSKHLLIEKSNIRKLVPIECERLQTIPDNYTQYGLKKVDTSKYTQLQVDILDQRPEWEYKTIKISNTQRYKMLGNGFTTDVIVHILKGMLK